MSEPNTEILQDNLAEKLSIQSQLTLFFIAGVFVFALLGAFINGVLSGMRYESDLDKEGINLIRFLEHEAREHIIEGDKQEFKLIAAGVLLDPRVKHVGVYNLTGKILFSSEQGISALHQKRILSEEMAKDSYKILVIDDLRHFIYPLELTEKEEELEGAGTIGFVDVALDDSLIFKTRTSTFIWTFIITAFVAAMMMAVIYIYMGHLSQPIKDLADAMLRAQSGVKGVRVTPSGPREIFAMGSGFNKMIDQLEIRTSFLAKQKHELESLVHVREVTEHALKESTEKLTAVVNGAADGIVIIDDHLNIEIMNPAAERLFQYEDVFHRGLTITDLVPSLSKETDGVGLSIELHEFDNVEPFETTGHRSNDEQIPIELTISKMSVEGRIGYIVILRDIKERKLAQKALTRFKLSLDSSDDGIYIIDYRTMRFIDFNRSAWEYLGYNEQELMNLGPHDLQPYNTHTNIAITYNSVINGNSGAGRIETIFRRKDGSEFPVEIFIRSIEDEGERLIISVARDITERKRHEQELISYRDHLEEMVDMQTKSLVDARDAALSGERAMSTFLANMSHELRTPLHGILSFASIGIKKIDIAPTEKIKGFLKEIHDSGQNLLLLLNDLLDLSKLKSGKMVYGYSMHSMTNAVERVVREFDVLATNNEISTNVELIGKEVDVSMDSDRIMQVLRNLYSNAIKFSDNKSVIEITIDYTEMGLVTVSVKDNGIGVPESELDSIFESFVQSSKTATNAGGTGLGLTISKEIIESGHNGELRAKNAEEGGAVFFFTLSTDVSVDLMHEEKSALHVSLS